MFASTQQPIAWGKAILCGIIASTLLMGFMDIFFMLGMTPFSFEQYLGSLLRGSIYGQHNWTLGLFANWFFGGLFGCLYAYAFEYVFHRANGRIGTALGLGHFVIAGIAVFPFFNILHEQVGTGIYPGFGFFGVGLGAPTPILLLMAHLLFGSAMGTFYGPVRAHRVRARAYEPGETSYPGDEIDVITTDHDPEDSQLVYPQGA